MTYFRAQSLKRCTDRLHPQLASCDSLGDKVTIIDVFCLWDYKCSFTSAVQKFFQHLIKLTHEDRDSGSFKLRYIVRASANLSSGLKTIMIKGTSIKTLSETMNCRQGQFILLKHSNHRRFNICMNWMICRNFSFYHLFSNGLSQKHKNTEGSKKTCLRHQGSRSQSAAMF